MMKKLLIYSAVFMGCFFEGETSLITSSFAAHRGYLEIVTVITLAFLATQTWDWTWFIIGRKKGRQMVERKPRLNQKVIRIHKLLEKNRYLSSLVIVFFTGSGQLVRWLSE